MAGQRRLGVALRAAAIAQRVAERLSELIRARSAVPALDPVKLVDELMNIPATDQRVDPLMAAMATVAEANTRDQFTTQLHVDLRTAGPRRAIAVLLADHMSPFGCPDRIDRARL